MMAVNVIQWIFVWLCLYNPAKILTGQLTDCVHWRYEWCVSSEIRGSLKEGRNKTWAKTLNHLVFLDVLELYQQFITSSQLYLVSYRIVSEKTAMKQKIVKDRDMELGGKDTLGGISRERMDINHTLMGSGLPLFLYQKRRV